MLFCLFRIFGVVMRRALTFLCCKLRANFDFFVIFYTKIVKKAHFSDFLTASYPTLGS